MVLAFTSSTVLADGREKFTVHEWGTFTSVQGADGVQMEWSPLLGTDLPSFVYDPSKLAAAGWQPYDDTSKAALRAITRMETPVIYFYANGSRTVDVHVDFPRGRITEWYPRATSVRPGMKRWTAEQPEDRQSFIEWKGVRILAPETAEVTADWLIRERGHSHYYQARETKANLLRVESETLLGTPEYDRLLFYRGVADFQPPLQVKVIRGDATLLLSTGKSAPLTDLFALTIQGRQARYQHLPRVSVEQPVTIDLAEGSFRPLREVRRELMAEMQAALVREGLFPREAAAMVNTWEDQWYGEEGTRVLYLLPREWTEHVLPLRINPTPAEIVRVMVGRSEVIPPNVERELRRQVLIFTSGNATARTQAPVAVRRLGLGRFLGPALERALGVSPDQELSEAAWNLARAVYGEASRAVVERSPASGDPAQTAPSRSQSEDLVTAF